MIDKCSSDAAKTANHQSPEAWSQVLKYQSAVDIKGGHE